MRDVLLRPQALMHSLLFAVAVAATAATADGCGPNTTLETAFFELPRTRIIVWDAREVKVEITSETLPVGHFRLDVRYKGIAPVLEAASVAESELHAAKMQQFHVQVESSRLDHT